METRVWGPGAWLFIHSTAWHYDRTRDQSEEFFEFYRDLGYVLPCLQCRKHYREHLDEGALREALNSTDPKALWKWSVEIHNRVNVSLGRSEWSEERAREWLINHYQDSQQRLMENEAKQQRYIRSMSLMFVMFMLLIIVIRRRYWKERE